MILKKPLTVKMKCPKSEGFSKFKGGLYFVPNFDQMFPISSTLLQVVFSALRRTSIIDVYISCLRNMALKPCYAYALHQLIWPSFEG